MTISITTLNLKGLLATLITEHSVIMLSDILLSDMAPMLSAIQGLTEIIN
jgi:hypothetical protein